MVKRSSSSYSRSLAGFITHLIIFIFVNVIIWYVNFAAFENRDFIKGHIEKDILQMEFNSDEQVKFKEILNNDTFFPWAGIVTFAWGIGIAANFFDLLLARRKMKELKNITPLNEDEYSAYLRITRHRSEMIQHTCSAFSIPVLLFYIAYLIPVSFPWFLIPIGILIFSWLIHVINYFPKKKSLIVDLCELKKCDRWSELFL